jgi:hypothetical protein
VVSGAGESAASKDVIDNSDTADIRVHKNNLFPPDEIFIELKLNMRRKDEVNRLVGQLEDLEPKTHCIVVVLLGNTRPECHARLRKNYKQNTLQRALSEGESVHIILK